AGFVCGSLITLGGEHTTRRWSGMRASLQGETLVGDAWQVDDGELQSLAGMYSHDADYIGGLFTVVLLALAPAASILAQGEQDTEVIEEALCLLSYIRRLNLLTKFRRLLRFLLAQGLLLLIVVTRHLQQAGVIGAERVCLRLPGFIEGDQQAAANRCLDEQVLRDERPHVGGGIAQCIENSGEA